MDSQEMLNHYTTEYISNSANPQFTQSIRLTYFFEMVQELNLVVYDVDNDSSNLKQQDFVGNLTITVGQVVGARGMQCQGVIM